MAPIAEAPAVAGAPLPVLQPTGTAEARYSRRNERASLTGDLVTDKGERFAIINVSESGVFVKSKSEPAVGTRIQFRIETREFAPLHGIVGVVVRRVEMRETVSLGIELQQLQPAQREVLRGYVRSKVFK